MASPTEILDACDHKLTGRERSRIKPICRTCAERAVEAAREEERAAALATIERLQGHCGRLLERHDKNQQGLLWRMYCGGLCWLDRAGKALARGSR